MKKILSWLYIVGIAAIATYVLVNQPNLNKTVDLLLSYGFIGGVLLFLIAAFVLYLAFTTVYVMRKMLDIAEKKNDKN